MSFLKGKNTNGEQTLIAVSQIQTVATQGDGTAVTLLDGDVVYLELGFQAVSNRLKDLGEDIA